VTTKAPSIGSTEDYCALNSGHTMCIYPGPSEQCASQTILRGLTQEGKDAILAHHNKLRRKIAKGEQNNQPPAANMRELVWDNELEALAQRLADQCQFAHDKVRPKLDGTSVGQNLFIDSKTSSDDQAALTYVAAKPAQSWYNEVTNPGFDSAHIEPFVFGAWGHYSQVVWADSYSLGCANTYYFDGEYYNNLVVCNYATTGNLVGGSMYKQGSACSQCPEGTTCSDSLCKAV